VKTNTDIQIRFGDVDMLQHINNVNMQHYFDLGKGDFFRALLPGEPYSEPKFITASTTTSYFEQTRFEDKIYVETSLEKIGNKSFTLFQRIINKTTGSVHAESHTVMVMFDFKAQVTISIPDSLRSKMSER